MNPMLRAICLGLLIAIIPAEGCSLGSAPSTESWCPGERMWDFKKNRSDLTSLAATPKYFIISMGPPASGKSSSLGYIQEKLNIKTEPILEIIVDDIVASFPAYREEIKKMKQILGDLHTQTTDRLRSELQKKGPGLSADELKKKVEAMEKDPKVDIISEPLLGVVCNMSQTIYFPHRSWADQKSNSLLLEEFIEPVKYRHVVYESTGSNNAFGWANDVARMAAVHGFVPILMYPFVETDQLKRRAFLRSSREGRLPCSGMIESISKQARDNFVRAVETMTSVTGDSPYKEIFLVDNRGGAPIPLAEFSSEGATWYGTAGTTNCSLPDADFLCRLPGNPTRAVPGK